MRKLLAATATALVLVLSACSSTSSIEAQDEREPAKADVVEAPAVEKVVVPDVVGMDPQAALDEISAESLEGSIWGDDGSAYEGQIVKSQEPAAGASVDEGSGVLITVGVPDPDGSRDLPFPAGTVLSASEGGVETLTVTVGPATWNADATVMAENQFNDPAPEGSVYVLVPVTITNVGSAEAVIPWLAVDIAYVAPDGRSYDRASAVIPGNINDIGDLYEGGSATGNLAFVLPTTAQGGVWAVSNGWSDPVFVAAN